MSIASAEATKNRYKAIKKIGLSQKLLVKKLSAVRFLFSSFFRKRAMRYANILTNARRFLRPIFFYGLIYIIHSLLFLFWFQCLHSCVFRWLHANPINLCPSWLNFSSPGRNDLPELNQVCSILFWFNMIFVKQTFVVL